MSTHIFTSFHDIFSKTFRHLYNITTNLIKVIESLCSKATCAVYYHDGVGEWFRSTVGVRQGCLVSLTLFNISLERIMTDTLEVYERSVSIGG